MVRKQIQNSFGNLGLPSWMCELAMNTSVVTHARNSDSTELADFESAFPHAPITTMATAINRTGITLIARTPRKMCERAKEYATTHVRSGIS